MKNQFIKFSITTLLVFATFSVFYCIACYWSNGATGFQSWYGNSDFIQIPIMTNSFLYEHAHIKDWNFAQTPYFFPDLAVSYIISLFTHNIITNMLVYGTMQSLYLLLIIALLLKLITDNSIKISFGIAFVLVVLLCSSELISLDGKPAALQLLESMPMSSQHFGATILTFTCLYLFIQIYNHKNNYLIALFCLITIAGVFSDLLLAFYFSIPLIFTLGVWGFLNPEHRQFCWKGIALLSILIIGSYLLYRLLPISHFFDHHIIYQHNKFKEFIKLFFVYLKLNPIIGTLWLSFLIWAPFSLIRTYRQQNESFQKISWINFIILFELITILACVPGFVLRDNNLHGAVSHGFFNYCHLQPLILGPVLIGFPLLLCKHTKIFELLTRNYIFGGLLCLIIIRSMSYHPALNISNIITYYPPEIACLDEHVQQLHLHNGMGNYWQAKSFTQFNHSGIKIAAITDRWNAYFWTVSKQAFDGDQFDFLIFKSPNETFNQQKVLARFGKPTATFTCPGDYKFYVYKNNAMKGFFASAQLVDSPGK